LIRAFVTLEVHKSRAKFEGERLSAVHEFAFHNDAVVRSRDVRLSPFQTGLLSGWGLFSTLRIYEGVPFALEAHIERLVRDAARLNVEIGSLPQTIPAAFAQLIRANAEDEAMARIYLIRNRGGLLDTPGQPATDLLIFTAALRHWEPVARLCIQEHGRDTQAALTGTKTLTWANNLLLHEEANRRSYADALLLNERGEVAECTSANVFMVAGGRVLTPPLDSGALPGISRKVLMSACSARGIAIEEAPIRPADLLAADEVFITSSTREIQPVGAIDEKQIPLGPVTRRLQGIFKEAVREYLASNASGFRALAARG
jgi:branched-chain amino acid aminotransferase